MNDVYEMYYTLGLYNGMTEEDAVNYAKEMTELVSWINLNSIKWGMYDGRALRENKETVKTKS